MCVYVHLFFKIPEFKLVTRFVQIGYYLVPVPWWPLAWRLQPGRPTLALLLGPRGRSVSQTRLSGCGLEHDGSRAVSRGLSLAEQGEAPTVFPSQAASSFLAPHP